VDVWLRIRKRFALVCLFEFVVVRRSVVRKENDVFDKVNTNISSPLSFSVSNANRINSVDHSVEKLFGQSRNVSPFVNL
jgi:hypothetical protein